MSYQEKKTIASVVSGIILLSSYCAYFIIKYQEVGADLLNDLVFWSTSMLIFIGVGIVITIVIQILFHIILAISKEVKKEITKEMKKHTSNLRKCNKFEETFEETEIAEHEDEMDKLIALKATRNSYIFVFVGFVSALISLYIKMPPAIMLNIIFISFMTGSVFEGLSQLYFYRRGVRNG